MSYTGNGTVDDPYIVDNWEDMEYAIHNRKWGYIRWAEVSDKYIENVTLTTHYWNGETGDFGGISTIDFNGWTFNNLNLSGFPVSTIPDNMNDTWRHGYTAYNICVDTVKNGIFNHINLGSPRDAICRIIEVHNVICNDINSPSASKTSVWATAVASGYPSQFWCNRLSSSMNNILLLPYATSIKNSKIVINTIDAGLIITAPWDNLQAVPRHTPKFTNCDICYNHIHTKNASGVKQFVLPCSARTVFQNCYIHGTLYARGINYYLSFSGNPTTDGWNTTHLPGVNSYPYGINCIVDFNVVSENYDSILLDANPFITGSWGAYAPSTIHWMRFQDSVFIMDRGITKVAAPEPTYAVTNLSKVYISGG